MDTATIIGIIVAFVVVIAGFGFGIWLLLIRQLNSKDERIARIEARNKERLALIEKGLDPNLVEQAPVGRGNRPLMIGVIIVFACLGRIIAALSMFNSSADKTTMIYILPAFFVGLGLLVYHFYLKGIFSGRSR